MQQGLLLSSLFLLFPLSSVLSGVMFDRIGTVWPTFVAMIGRMFKQSSGAAIGLIIAVGGLAVPIMHQIIGVLSREEMFGLRYTLLGLGIFTLGNMFVVRRIEQLEKRGAGGV